MQKRADIIIAGGGPAGLSLSKELSKEYNVIVLEKGKIGHSSKTWYSYKDRILKNRLYAAVVSESDRIEFRTVYNHHFMKDKAVVVDKDKVLKQWVDENNSDIRQENFIDLERKDKNKVIVRTDKQSYTCSLFIDCMGANSPLVQKNNLIDFFLVWSCFGYRLKGVYPPEHIQFLPMNDKYNTYKMLYKTSKDEADVVLFSNLNRNIDPIKDKKIAFDRMLAKEYRGAKKIELLNGNIMTGRLRTQALDNVLFYGDSGMYTPASCGMGFNQCLQTHKKMAESVIKRMDKGTLTAKDLSGIRSEVLKEWIMDFMQIIIKVGYYNNTQEGWRKGVNWLNAMGNDSKYWMRNEISLKWARKSLEKFYQTNTLVDIAKSVPPKEYLFIARTSAQILKNFTIEEAKEVFMRYHPAAIEKRMLAEMVHKAEKLRRFQISDTEKKPGFL